MERSSPGVSQRFQLLGTTAAVGRRRDLEQSLSADVGGVNHHEPLHSDESFPGPQLRGRQETGPRVALGHIEEVTEGNPGV